MQNELKPCPFCGSEAIKITNAKKLEDCENFEECESCGFKCVVCDFNAGGCGASSGYHIDLEETIEAWNRRVDNA